MKSSRKTEPAPVARPGVLPVPSEELGQVVHGEHGNPHGVLGPHPHDGGVTVRVLKPLAPRVAFTRSTSRKRARMRSRNGPGIPSAAAISPSGAGVLPPRAAR